MEVELSELFSSLEALRHSVEECRDDTLKKTADDELEDIVKKFDTAEKKFMCYEEFLEYKLANLQATEDCLRRVNKEMFQELGDRNVCAAPKCDADPKENQTEYMAWLTSYWAYLRSANKLLPLENSKYWYALMEKRRDVRQTTMSGSIEHLMESVWTLCFQIRQEIEKLTRKLDDIKKAETDR